MENIDPNILKKSFADLELLEAFLDDNSSYSNTQTKSLCKRKWGELDENESLDKKLKSK